MTDQIATAKPSLESRIQRAEEIARQSLGLPFGVQEFAEAAGLSRSRFSVAYQAHRGISAGCFLRKERMERAVALLSATEEPIARVGALVGYPEPTGFGRAFRRHTGLSPSRWRRTVRKTTAQTNAVSEVVPTEGRLIRDSEIIASTGSGPNSEVRFSQPQVPGDIEALRQASHF